MAKRYIAPLGFIRQTTNDGAIFTLSEARDSENLRNNTSVTVWRYSPEQLALAKIRGLITAVGYVTATFRTVESTTDPRWPEEEEILRERTPGLPGPKRHLRAASETYAHAGAGRQVAELWPTVQEPEGRPPTGRGSQPRSRRRTIDCNLNTANAKSLTNTVHSEKL